MISSEQIVEDGGEFDRAVALHAVAGAIDDDHIGVGLASPGLGDVLVVHDG